MEKIFSLNGKLFKIALFSIVILEFFSLYGFVYPILNKAVFVLILLATLYLSSKKLSYGIYIVLAELIIASKGYLFSWEIGDKALSIRIGIFLAVMLIWFFNVLKNYFKKKKMGIAFLKSNLFPYYLVLFLFLVWGIISGIIQNNNLGNLFFDFNGWLYFVLIFPLFEAIKKENFKDLASVVVAALVALILKTFLVLFIFSHQITYIIPGLYRWIRVTGVGEITGMDFGFSRIFFQSHIYAILGFFILLPLINKNIAVKKQSLKNNFSLLLLTITLFAIVIVSFSRSFWAGSFITIFLYFVSLAFLFKDKFKIILVKGALLVSIVLSSLFLTGVLIKFPVPFYGEDIKLTSVLSDRATNISEEAAIGSRWNLVKPLWQETAINPLTGSGFGKTVTYKTLDPRALASNPTNEYTTYAFEWGYLDIWLKLGLFGLLAYFVLIWRILKEGWKFKDDRLFLGSVFGVIALGIIHFFTPYLNHPLGIGYLVLVSVVYEKNR